MIKHLPPILQENSRRYGFLLFLFFSLFLTAGAFAQTYAPTVKSDKDDYAPGEVAIITGTGWTKDQQVDVHFEETPAYHAEHQHDYHGIVVDANGNWTISYQIETRHIGVAFTVHAIGKTSLYEAKAYFTDANVRVQTNAGTITVSYKITNSLDCTGDAATINNLNNPGSSTANTGNTFSVPVTSTQSVQLTAPMTNLSGQTFSNWTSNTAFTISNTSNPNVICVRGDVSNGAVTYFANYVTTPAPIISSINPTSGPVGTSITLTGTNFTGATAVKFNGTAATTYTVNSATQIIATVPSGATTGNITVTTPGGTSNGLSFTILVAPTITFNNIEKTYGNAGFNLSATSNSLGGFTYSIVSGTGATVTANGAVTITGAGSVEIKATQAANGNYTDGEKIATLLIKQVALTITADAKEKVYGTVADPALTYQVTTGSVVGSDAFTGALSRAAGSAVGTYAITSTLANNNYDITFVGANFSITARPITITADAKEKVYGTVADPALTYQVTTGSVVGSDAFTGALSRAAGSAVGTYAITSTLANNNYDITFVGANFSITARPITITADAKEKVYGTVADPALTYQVTTGSVVGSDAFTGALSRAAGSAVGTYAITSTLANNNYDITFVGANFSITARPITITADAKEKVYGTVADPALTYQVTTGSVVGSDAFTGALSRAAGSAVGTYAITSTLANNNYDITFVGANFSITARPITITADAKEKVYGTVADPALTYQVTTGSVVGSDAFTGALSRAAGSAVGTYAITSTLANNNYDITFVGANFSITARPITITADAKEKVYGTVADPALTYQVTTGSVVGSDAFTGALSRAAGSAVGTYAITSTLANNNYDITFVGANFSITARPITITADAKEKVYGTVADPALTYQVTTGSVVGSDAFTGALSRAAGSAVGTYAITSTLANNNYDITFVGANFSITARPITITADAKEKVYGTVADPALTYQVTTGSVVGSDAFTGALSRAAGSAVGTYAITSTLANNNYDITFVGANFSITARPITITADAKEKVYGTVADPALTYQVTTGSVVGSDAFTGALSRAAGSAVGTYAITSTLANNNYDITFVGANFSITARPITITADAKEKVYGTVADPALTYQVTTGSVVGSDAFTGALSRAAGSAVGTYAITSTLANNNYDITFVGANFSITARPITITADAKEKVYGTVADPALTYQVTTGSVVGSDAFTGALSRAAGSAVGTYAITSTLANNNYDITFVGANFSITARPITITADAKEKVYGTVADPALTYQVTTGSVVGSDAFTGALSRAAGSAVGTYAITSTLANNNYDITFVGANFSITARPITITTDAKEKMIGTNDPNLTYAITTGSLVGTDAFTGALTREVGEVRGTYAILIGSVALNSNYNLSYVGANLTIYAKPIVSLIVSNPLPISTTSSQVTTEFGDDVFNRVISVTAPSNATTNNSSVVINQALGTVTITSSVVGVFSISLSYKDGVGNPYTSGPVYAVFYDPSAGFVTGGGFINSPEDKTGTYKFMNVTGKAHFGFVSKYEKGANKPTGNTEFQFQAAGMNFKSSIYEWLTVAGTRAQYKGSGTINGTGDYGFMLTAVDGDLGQTKTSDLFRIKIWDKNNGSTVVYDNQLGASDDPNSLVDNLGTKLGGGSIVIHQPANKAPTKDRVATEGDMFAPVAAESKLAGYPNPFRGNATIAFTFAQDEDYKLDVYDMKGSLVKSLPAGKARANTQVEVKLDGANTPVGVYILRLTTKSGVQNLRMVRE